LEPYKNTVLRKFRQDGYLLFFLIPALVFIFLFTVYPIIYNLIISFQQVNVFTLNSKVRPFIGFGNYKTILQDPAFLEIAVNTVIFTVSSVIIQFVIGYILALLFVRSSPLKSFSRTLIFIGWVIPDIVVGTIWVNSNDVIVIEEN